MNEKDIKFPKRALKSFRKVKEKLSAHFQICILSFSDQIFFFHFLKGGMHPNIGCIQSSVLEPGTMFIDS